MEPSRHVTVELEKMVARSVFAYRILQEIWWHEATVWWTVVRHRRSGRKPLVWHLCCLVGQQFDYTQDLILDDTKFTVWCDNASLVSVCRRMLAMAKPRVDRNGNENDILGMHTGSGYPFWQTCLTLNG